MMMWRVAFRHFPLFGLSSLAQCYERCPVCDVFNAISTQHAVCLLRVIAVVDIVSAAEPQPQPSKVDTQDNKPSEPGDLRHRMIAVISLLFDCILLRSSNFHWLRKLTDKIKMLTHLFAADTFSFSDVSIVCHISFCPIDFVSDNWSCIAVCMASWKRDRPSKVFDLRLSVFFGTILTKAKSHLWSAV